MYKGRFIRQREIVKMLITEEIKHTNTTLMLYICIATVHSCYIWNHLITEEIKNNFVFIKANK